MTSREIRTQFLEFFRNKGHKIVKSAPMVIKNDPTLMFTNAGMNQFKDAFLGNSTPESLRIADTQKCLRVSGKHNDLEEVGHDTYHHTMFEMLGNWSFGNYFKKETIEWAWELLTKVYELPKERLFATVFEGDKSEELEADEESYAIWKTIIPEERIIFDSKKDNFWEMGDAGPCGPSSEIHIDLRSEEDIAKLPSRQLVNKDHPEVIEIWNLVFMEFNRKADGTLEKLPQKHVDTGMGLERLCMAVQGKKSAYDTDLFAPLINLLSTLSGKKYGSNDKTDIALRVAADHIRAVVFALADGQLPSNTGAGYVIRRILRRAVRYGYSFLDLKEPFLYKLVPIVADIFVDIFPEVIEQKGFIEKVIKEEEITFLRTLENGLRRIREEISEKKVKTIDGKTAFELYDTYGFPPDLTALIARENDLDFDEKGFKTEMQKQKARSRKDAESETGDWIIVNEGEGVEFVGYDKPAVDTKILKYRTVKTKAGEQCQIVLEKTPFYPEGGGQIGDTGTVRSDNETLSVIDTQRENELVIHITDKTPEDSNAQFHAEINQNKRLLTQNNHSATHLLHAALKQVLGEHVNQKGSYVSDQLLRFDFSHFAKLTDEELLKIEQMVNFKIRQNISLNEKREVPFDEALKSGATALFGEKYGDSVRMITFDPDYSVELCGGTHVSATGQIGLFKIISENSVAAGVRRIEAITGEASESYVNENIALLHELKAILKQPKDLKKAVIDLTEERKKLLKQNEILQADRLKQLKNELLKGSETTDGIHKIIKRVEVPSDEALKKLSFDIKNQTDQLFMVLVTVIDEKPRIAVTIGEKVVSTKKLHAGNIVRELATEIQGGGGGQDYFATAGGKNINGLDAVLNKAKTYI